MVTCTVDFLFEDGNGYMSGTGRGTTFDAQPFLDRRELSELPATAEGGVIRGALDDGCDLYFEACDDGVFAGEETERWEHGVNVYVDEQEYADYYEARALSAFRNRPEPTASKDDPVLGWYRNAFPDDDIVDGAPEDRWGLTFADVYGAMEDGGDFYEIIGIGDSVVRERVFGGIADAYGIDYDAVYDLWLRSA